MTHLFTCWYKTHVHFVYIDIHSPTTSFSINLLQLSLTPCYYQVGPLLSQPILNLFITKSKRWWKHSSEIVVYINMTPLHSFYRFVGFTSMM